MRTLAQTRCAVLSNVTRHIRSMGSRFSRTVEARNPLTTALPLPGLGVTSNPGDVENLGEVFRRLYYNLYSNSAASRAERILEDLSLILLAKLAAENDSGDYSKLLPSDASADVNGTFIPALRAAFPDL